MRMAKKHIRYITEKNKNGKESEGLFKVPIVKINLFELSNNKKYTPDNRNKLQTTKPR